MYLSQFGFSSPSLTRWRVGFPCVDGCGRMGNGICSQVCTFSCAFTPTSSAGRIAFHFLNDVRSLGKFELA